MRNKLLLKQKIKIQLLNYIKEKSIIKNVLHTSIKFIDFQTILVHLTIRKINFSYQRNLKKIRDDLKLLLKYTFIIELVQDEALSKIHPSTLTNQIKNRYLKTPNQNILRIVQSSAQRFYESNINSIDGVEVSLAGVIFGAKTKSIKIRFGLQKYTGAYLKDKLLIERTTIEIPKGTSGFIVKVFNKLGPLNLKAYYKELIQ